MRPALPFIAARSRLVASRFVGSLFSRSAVVRPSTAPDAPVARLTVNHSRSPVPLSASAVRFGWRLTAVDVVGASQVVVARTAADARAGHGTVWDSGRRTLDDPGFSDLCHTVPLGSDGIVLEPEAEVWWAVRLWAVDGQAYGWSEPSRLVRSDVRASPPPPRSVATVSGTLPTTAGRPAGDESLFRWLMAQGAPGVWPLLSSVDLSCRVSGWLERLRSQQHPGDPRGAELYRVLLEAADLCYDDPGLRAQCSLPVDVGPAVTGRVPARAAATSTVGPAGPPPAAIPPVHAPLPTGTDLGVPLGTLLAPLLGSRSSAAPLPVGLVVSEVAGVRATAPGYRRFRVEPCLLPQATTVDVELDTPRGPIVVRLRRHATTLAGAQVTLGVPSGAVATLVLPWSGEEVVLDAGSYVFVNV